MNSHRLPNLVISGVVKGGTTSLFSYLSRHPDICSSSVKETCYFSSYRYGSVDVRYKDVADPFLQYQQYFSACKDQAYVMEATPGYFEGGKTLAEAIKSQLGDDVKILIILRNPVDRLMSFFKFKKSMLELPSDLSLSAYIQQCRSIPVEDRPKRENNVFWGIEGGLYINYLDDWFSVFEDSLKVVFFDQLQEDPIGLLKDISRWLAVDSEIFEKVNLTVENKTVAYKYRTLQELAIFFNKKAEKFWRQNPSVKKKLRTLYYALNASQNRDTHDRSLLTEMQEFYAPYNRKLFQYLVNRGYSDLPDWLNT